MGKQRKQRPASTQKPYGRRNWLQSAERDLAPQYPSSLNANLSASGASHVSAQTLSQNTISGDMNINNNFFGKKDVSVTQNTSPPVSEDTPLPQGAFTDSEKFLKTVLRTPENKEKKTPTNQSPHRSTEPTRRENVPRRKLIFGNDIDQPQLLLDEGSKTQGEFVHSSAEEHSITGEIKCTKVTVSYRCDKCGAAIRYFKHKDFSVKCNKCKQSWKCAKVQYTCRAEITIELSRGEEQTVELSDSLLHSIVNFDREGYCNTDQIADEVLKLGNVRVDFENGEPKRVNKIGTS